MRLLDGSIYDADLVEIRDGLVLAIARLRAHEPREPQRYAWRSASVAWIRWLPA